MKIICANCKKEYNDLKEIKEYENERECECGGKTFIYGEGITINDDDNIVCKCDNKSFDFVSHYDFKYHADTNYVCKKCKNNIGITSYRIQEIYY